jgi:O-acetyl-ADP-ribose deacetylase (regulator of RNase III)
MGLLLPVPGACLRKGDRQPGFPFHQRRGLRVSPEKAAEIASREIGGFLAGRALPEKIRMVCFDAETLRVYGKAFG